MCSLNVPFFWLFLYYWYFIPHISWNINYNNFLKIYPLYPVFIFFIILLFWVCIGLYLVIFDWQLILKIQTSEHTKTQHMLLDELYVPGWDLWTRRVHCPGHLVGGLWLSVSQLLLWATQIPQTRAGRIKIGKGQKGPGGVCKLSLLPPIYLSFLLFLELSFPENKSQIIY